MWWRNNGLSVVTFLLFLLCLVGHSWSGWYAHNEDLEQHGREPIPYSSFLKSSEFGETVFENWESEFFQMGFYVLLTAFLFQKGSSESKDPDGKEEVDQDPSDHRKDKNAPWPVRRGGWILKLYQNSLSLAMLLLFLLTFVGHLITGGRKYNEEQIEHGEPPLSSSLEYIKESRFWYESFQNWQSEFLAVLAIVVLSIWLRQKGSPESKPVHASNDETGTS